MIGFCFQSKVNSDTFNERHMLPSLLEQNNGIYKDTESYNTHLDMLYGARFTTSVFQRGEMISSQFFIRIINDKYVQKTDDLMTSALEFLHNIIYRPKMYRGKITKKAVNDKLEETEDILNTIHQDKASLAYYNFLKQISSDIHPNHFPIESKLALVNQDSLTNVYHELIQNDALKIYVIGDFDADKMDGIIKSFVRQHSVEATSLNYRVTLPIEEKMGDVIETSDVSISRVYIGYKIHIDLDAKEESMMELLNIILGAHSQSKLFKIIREEMHLVYYIYSTYMTENEMFVIHFECEDQDEQKSIDQVKTIVTHVQNGDISEEELSQAKHLLNNNYLSMMDHLNGRLKMNIISDLVEKKPFNMDKKIELIQSITSVDLITFSNRLKDHVTYRFKKGGDTSD